MNMMKWGVPIVCWAVIALLVILGPPPKAQTSVTTFALTVSGCGTLGTTVYNVNTFVPLTVTASGKVCHQ
jgi:hypothetical protein